MNRPLPQILNPIQQRVLDDRIEALDPQSRALLTLLMGGRNPQESIDLTASTSPVEERLGTLADALGACDLCWGEDDQCRRCRGKGSPGARKPSPEAFAEYVMPVIARMARN